MKRLWDISAFSEAHSFGKPVLWYCTVLGNLSYGIVSCFLTSNRFRGMHNFGDAKKICPNLLLFFPNNVWTASLNVKTIPF